MCVMCAAQPNTQQAKDFHKETSEAFALVAQMVSERLAEEAKTKTTN